MLFRQRCILSWFCLGLAWGWPGLAIPADPSDEPSPALVVDADGHSGTIREVLVAAEGQELITVSLDKTVRGWDTKTGEVLWTLRPPAGEGDEGKLYAAALTPDGRTLAVGGQHSGNPIFLISLLEQRVVRILRGHENAIQALAFSADGKHLVSGSSDQTARIWNVATGDLEQTLAGHRGRVSGVAFSPDGNWVATASYDQTAAIWAAPTGTRFATLEGHDREVTCVAWSSNGLIASGSKDATVRLWNAEGACEHVYDQLGTREICSLAFASAGHRLLATQGIGSGPRAALVLNAAADGRRPGGGILHRFLAHSNTIVDGVFSPDGQWAATTGGNNNETWIWASDPDSTERQPARRLLGRGRAVWSVGWSTTGRVIAWGTENEGAPNGKGTLTEAFDLAALEHVAVEKHTFARAREEQGGQSLEPDTRTSLLVRSAPRPSVRLVFDTDYLRQFNRINSYTLFSADRAVVGADFGLDVFNTRTGEPAGVLRGHHDAVWSMAPSPDGQYLLTGSSDMTLRIWKAGRERPLVSLFFAGREWIAWTPEGYYACSPGGERRMGWQIDRGREQLAAFAPASRFRNSFYRPDAIQRLLETGSVAAALGEARVDPAAILPPRVEVLSPAAGETVSTGRIAVQARVTARGGQPVKDVGLLIDGRRYDKIDRGKDIVVVPSSSAGADRSAWTVDLAGFAAGRHELQVIAETAASVGASPAIGFLYQPASGQRQRLPALRILAIGIAEYEQADLRLKFAARDAQRLSETFQKHSANLFREIDVQIVTDKQADQRNIVRQLLAFRERMSKPDVGIVFYSGHGHKAAADGLFYFVPADADRREAEVTCVPESRLRDVLATTPGRILVILDACHAGAAGAKNLQPLTDDLIRDLLTDDYGAMVMCSSMGCEPSYENPDQQLGHFTAALIEGLQGQADLNGDGAVYTNELDVYVAQRVKVLSGDQQHPVSEHPASMRAFPLSQVKHQP